LFRQTGQKALEEKVLRVMKNRSVNSTFAKIDVNDIVWASPNLWYFFLFSFESLM